MPPIWTTLDRSNLAAESVQSPSPILDVFLDALDLNATDPRDKLFALLPFSKENSAVRAGELAELQPDYTKEPEKIYASVTRWLIRKTDTLPPLLLCPLPGRTNPEPRFLKPSLDRKFSFRARSTTVLDRCLLDDESDPLALKVSGHKLGIITMNGYPPLIAGSRGGDAYTSPITRLNIFGAFRNIKEFRTGVGVPLFIFRDVPPFSVMDKVQAGIRFERNLLSNWEEPVKDNVNDWAKEGDTIAVFHGATVPYLLRPVGNEDSAQYDPVPDERDEKYKLVGECFVGGIMDGSFMDKKLKSGEPSRVFMLV
ncbi:hypothetical protein F4818DRAFT_446048 [Hypoxylon cercidicola]|nr:hypothetical protein F4818DRAFT_446048 [Hypoxylon cercidicola]